MNSDHNLELRHLHYFIAVAEELHFARAAHRLHMAQQPLSIQIRRLEDMLGVTLFRRTTRRVELTDAGCIFLEQARQTLWQAEQAVIAAREAERGARGKITVGYVSTTLYNLMPGIVRAFRSAYPAVEVALRELCTPELDEQVARGALDCALTGTTPQISTLDSLLLRREPVVVVLPADHPFADLPEIPLRLLTNEPFIQYDRNAKRFANQEIVSLFHGANLLLNVVQEASTEQAMIALTAAGIGVSLVSESLIGLRTTEVVYRRLIEPGAQVEFNLIWQRAALSPVVRAFIETAQAFCEVGEVS